MIKIDQTHPKGCFQACVASILEMPIESVPDFCGDGWKGKDWWLQFQEWLKQRGMYALKFSTPTTPIKFSPTPNGLLVILSGYSKRGVLHTVVGEWGHGMFNVIHDPHESREGIITTTQILFFMKKLP